MDDSILLLLPDSSVNIIQPDITVHVSDVMAMYPGCHVSSLDSDEAVLSSHTVLLPGRTYLVLVRGAILGSDSPEEKTFKKLAREAFASEEPDNESLGSQMKKPDPEPSAAAGSRVFKGTTTDRPNRRSSALKTVEQAVSAFGACVDDTTSRAGDFAAEMAKRFAPDDDKCGPEALPGEHTRYAMWMDDANASRRRMIPRSSTFESGPEYGTSGITSGMAAFAMADAMLLSGDRNAAHHTIAQQQQQQQQQEQQRRFASPVTAHLGSHAAAYRSRHRRVSSQSQLSPDGPNGPNPTSAAAAADNWTGHVSPAHPLAQLPPFAYASSTQLSPDSLSSNGSFSESLSSGPSSCSSIALTTPRDGTSAAVAIRLFPSSRKFPSSSSVNGSSCGSIPIKQQEDLDIISCDSETPVLPRLLSGSYGTESSPRREHKRNGKLESQGKASLLRWFSRKLGDSNEGNYSHGRKIGSSRLSGLYIDSNSGTWSEEWC
ncbi:unnamed protein product [Closterium sp. Yama58-4]|nr:unnamed protein product [Closterium sp. Yama58-4]